MNNWVPGAVMEVEVSICRGRFHSAYGYRKKGLIHWRRYGLQFIQYYTKYKRSLIITINHKPRLPGPHHTKLNVDEQGVDVAILKWKSYNLRAPRAVLAQIGERPVS